MRDALLHTRALGLRYGAQVVLKGVDFEIHPGEIVTILGPNGSGKSSLLKLLIGAALPSSGEITKMPGLKIGYVPQKLQLDQAFPMTVEVFLKLAGPNTAADRRQMLVKFGLEQTAHRQMAALSGGQLQRALLAFAVIGNPHLLVLDEATRGLDQPAVAAFYQLIAEVRRDFNCAVLMVSHDLHVVMSASDRVICLNGHICCEGTPTVVSEAPEYRRLFGLGTEGALALYRHEHDHSHDHTHDHSQTDSADTGPAHD